MDTLIFGGTAVTPYSSRKMNIGISNGKICELLSPELMPQARKTIDATGMYIIPGCIDEHVHFNDPGTTHREDFAHGTAACAVGGITTAIAMPTNTPLVLNKKNLQLTLDAYEAAVTWITQPTAAWTLQQGPGGGILEGHRNHGCKSIYMLLLP